MEVLTRVEPERIAQLRARDDFFWLDLTRPTHDELTRLGEVLALHPLALEDTHEFGQRPKVDDYDDQVLLVFYSARGGTDPADLQPIEVHIYVSGLRRDGTPRAVLGAR